jgi:hypothetical protein
MDELSLAVMVLVPGAAAVAWLVTLHARVRQHSEALALCREDILYIRQRIDRALNRN